MFFCISMKYAFYELTSMLYNQADDDYTFV